MSIDLKRLNNHLDDCARFYIKLKAHLEQQQLNRVKLENELIELNKEIEYKQTQIDKQAMSGNAARALKIEREEVKLS